MKSEFEKTIEQAERNAANERISEGGISLPTMLGAAENAWGFFDEISRLDFDRRRVAGAPVPACREGCSHCCALRVTATPLELLALGLHLKETLAPEALATLIGRLSELAPEIARTDSFKWAARNIFCPLLKDGRCSVYARRPLNCRGWNSFHVNDCEKVPGNPHQVLEQAEYMRVGSIAVSRGLNGALVEAGLEAGEFELLTGLLAALSEEDAAGRWMRGEQVFAGRAVAQPGKSPQPSFGGQSKKKPKHRR